MESPKARRSHGPPCAFLPLEWRSRPARRVIEPYLLDHRLPLLRPFSPASRPALCPFPAGFFPPALPVSGTSLAPCFVYVAFAFPKGRGHG